MNGDRALIVVGGASLDTLHFAGRTEASAGGAGLYTALAAARAGAEVTMVGPRPDPMPSELVPALDLIEWRGRRVAPVDMPQFEIAHDGRGRTEMLRSVWGAESELTPESLPEGLPPGTVYCVPLADPARQLEFLRHFIAMGRPVAAGTFQCAIDRDVETVLEVFRSADVFFCNEREAVGLFGSFEDARTEPGRLLFITRGPLGARVVQGDHASDVAGLQVCELDPTGAGDTFCGTCLALLESGAHPVEAARSATAAAAAMVTGVGPAVLMTGSDLMGPEQDARIVVDDARVRVVAESLAGLPGIEPFRFTGELFPRPGDPSALDFFFSATLQQFGFWTAGPDGYEGPILAGFEGRMLKGSDILWACYRRWLDRSPDALTREGQAGISAGALEHALRSDIGAAPFEDLEMRLDLARGYGGDLAALGWSPIDIVQRANDSERPLEAFLQQLDRVAGYKEDPLRKKSTLLALILHQRPEGFLIWDENEEVPPIVDYHVQRSCLRLGLVRVTDERLREDLAARRRVSEEAEGAVRRSSFDAVKRLQRASGLSMGAIDWFLFQNRRRCPEMSEPECLRCPVDSVCAHAKDLFQPVFQTTFY